MPDDFADRIRATMADLTRLQDEACKRARTAALDDAIREVDAAVDGIELSSGTETWLRIRAALVRLREG